MDHPAYEIVTTTDGSPTLQTTGAGWSEKMHHAQGAFSETVFIYGRAIELTLKTSEAIGSNPSEDALNASPQLVVVGLGLGYIEILAAAVWIKSGYRPTQTQIVSYESDPYLTERLVAWVTQRSASASSSDQESSVHSASGQADELTALSIQIFAAHSQIADLTARHFGIQVEQIRSFLHTLLELQNWQMLGALNQPVTLTGKTPNVGANCICFDAFSKQATPNLWSQAFLVDFLRAHAANTCVFATYAATGDLNRALKQSSFVVHKIPGFGGRRESTLATRSAGGAPMST